MAREPKRAPDFLPMTGGTRPQGSTGGVADGSGAVVETHSTDEGGEPQGSRKGRPRDPLEGRGCPSGCIGRRKHSRDSELAQLCPRNSTDYLPRAPGKDPGGAGGESISVRDFRACIRRFQLRARLGPSWRIGDSPLTEPHRADFPQRVRQADSPPRLRDVLLVRGR